MGLEESKAMMSAKLITAFLDAYAHYFFRFFFRGLPPFDFCFNYVNNTFHNKVPLVSTPQVY